MDHSTSFFMSLNPLLQSIGGWGYALILLLAFAESLVVVGTFIPGVALVIFVGVLVSQGLYDMVDMIMCISVGAMLGDAASYLTGTYGTQLFKGKATLLKPALLHRGKAFLQKYGNKGVLLSRFFGPLRGVVPFIAGVTRMHSLSFFLWDALSCIAWATILILIGYYSGGTFS
jgi:membrane protein DedA with SNARE-associated domain